MGLVGGCRREGHRLLACDDKLEDKWRCLGKQMLQYILATLDGLILSIVWQGAGGLIRIYIQYSALVQGYIRLYMSEDSIQSESSLGEEFVCPFPLPANSISIEHPSHDMRLSSIYLLVFILEISTPDSNNHEDGYARSSRRTGRLVMSMVVSMDMGFRTLLFLRLFSIFLLFLLELCVCHQLLERHVVAFFVRIALGLSSARSATRPHI